MGDVPIQLLLAPVLAILALGWVLYGRFVRPKQLDQQYTQYRAAELAQRLRIALVSGDPSFNFFIRQANVDVARGPADGRPIHIEVRAEGAPDGTPLMLSYLYRVEQKSEIGRVVWTKWFDCRLSARARQPFPAFEVLSRNAPLGPIAQTLALPSMATGRPDVDATYAVFTNEPQMAALLGQHLAGFATFANSGVHLVGDGQTVSFVMKEDKAPLLANALYYAEAMATGVTAIARAVGG